MTHRNELILTVIICSAVVLFNIVGYVYIAPQILASRYLSRIHTEASGLSTLYDNLYRTIDLPLLNDGDASLATKVENANVIKKAIERSRAGIASLYNESQDMVVLPYSLDIHRQKSASVLQERVKTFFQQSNDAINEYEQLSFALMTYSESVSTMKLYIDNFNEVSNIDTYEGRSSEVRAVAQNIRVNIDQLEKQTLPQELSASKLNSIQAFRNAADGFDNLAHALEVASDNMIYTAAREIEAAGELLESSNQSDYGQIIQSSRAIKNIWELEEKLDFILR